MSQAQAVSHQNTTQPTVATLASRVVANVVPLRARRVCLPVGLDGPQADALLACLLHSPLGVYVKGTTHRHGTIHVTLDIATEDLDFTLHTLIATLPQATVGALVARQTARRPGMVVT